MAEHAAVVKCSADCINDPNDRSTVAGTEDVVLAAHEETAMGVAAGLQVVWLQPGAVPAAGVHSHRCGKDIMHLREGGRIYEWSPHFQADVNLASLRKATQRSKS